MSRCDPHDGVDRQLLDAPEKIARLPWRRCGASGRADTEQVELRALQIVREHALRSLEAIHLAVATLAAVPLLNPGDALGLASRDEAQRQAGIALGFVEV